MSLHEDDEEIDILHDRLMGKFAAETMSAAIGAQVTLLARFYERLGDHAVNLGPPDRNAARVNQWDFGVQKGSFHFRNLHLNGGGEGAHDSVSGPPTDGPYL